jgi:hypothetical protein
MAAPVKPVRARKPRPAAPPPLTERVDDADGEMFLKSLALVSKRVKEMRTKPRRVGAPARAVQRCCMCCTEAALLHTRGEVGV